MKSKVAYLCLGLVMSSAAQANLLVNGNLDKTYLQQIVPGFYLPKPSSWVNEGTRAISGPFEDEMSSEPWAGPAPTPVTTDGNTGGDWAAFFKPFTGNATDGATTAHLYQHVAATAGTVYGMSGWAGAEANFMAQGAVFALDFFDGSGGLLGSVVKDLMPTLKTPNGQAFSYKLYTLSGVAPVGTSTVRARVSMLDAMANPSGGGQAFVADDFSLVVVPEPSTIAVMALGALALVRRRRSK